MGGSAHFDVLVRADVVRFDVLFLVFIALQERPFFDFLPVQLAVSVDDLHDHDLLFPVLD